MADAVACVGSNEASTMPIYNTPKGGLFGGPFDSSGLDPNTRAVMMDSRWTTSYGGSTPAAVIPYAFPASSAPYLAVAGYPDWVPLLSFSALNQFQQAAVQAGFGLV